MPDTGIVCTSIRERVVHLYYSNWDSKCYNLFSKVFALPLNHRCNHHHILWDSPIGRQGNAKHCGCEELDSTKGVAIGEENKVCVTLWFPFSF